MAGVSDKARFYLERAAPELREFEDKEIFSKDEIRSLVNKRSEYEHLVLGPRTKPTDFLTYVEWEQSLDRLRAKRCRRLKVRSSSSNASQARTFGIFERGVTKHPGCVPLWRAYLDFAAQIKATKRWRRIVTRAIRLHPTDVGLWTLAGRRAARNGDMERARGHFLRGCRFCTAGPALWVEYARCEMEWLARIEAKKNGGGRKGGGGPAVNVMEAIKATEAGEQDGDHIAFDDDSDEEGDGDDVLMLPDPDAEEEGAMVKAKPKVFDEEATRKLEQSPALSGAIPMAIFDIAKKQRFFGAAAAEEFFDMFATFDRVSSQGKIVQHVLSTMEELFPASPCTCSCEIRQPLIGVDVHTPAFPQAVRESLSRLKAGLRKTTDKKALARKLVAWLETTFAVADLDPAIQTVLEHTKKSLEELLS
ncbi:U3 small nucleolar RNA-associated protein 6-domain-containing protein [Lasiosphaeria miniovina]|uniref:U3 small nucleolar RNA-associated protein 6-domain-containing protein n=1 Tax=Lasiosphaeria miniovina TaxID=1954250 RepID=A0AA40AB50_9PEZI|nr:U3 small nucleolar RNA-associated protein 6-domain-containing protein [Lasiosphaeria miniovina]KAK0712643.1 U3 small nucleolar RNA-associated protein 6-domain-containing protein [Lasiosphaeria miniovina]